MKRILGGEAASLREAPLPQTPSPEEQLGIGLSLPADLRAHASCGCSLIDLVESTAADRAAADMRRVGTHMERLQQLCSCWSLRPLTKSSTVFSNGKKQEKGKATSNK